MVGDRAMSGAEERWMKFSWGGQGIDYKPREIDGIETRDEYEYGPTSDCPG